MKFPRRKIATAGLVVIALVGAAVAARIIHSHRHSHSVLSGRNVYYCPMHPTYTSDRPGDCPICNMRLVARPKGFHDVCVMHNCAKIHEGRPCPMLVVAKEGETVTCPVCGTYVTGPGQAAPKKILYWTDPMMPGYKADKPGKSPMGMDLVPVYEETVGAGTGQGLISPQGYAPILVSPQKQQLIGVKTAPAQKRAMTKTIRTVGRVAYDPELYQAEAEYLQALRAFQNTGETSLAEARQQADLLLEGASMRLRLLGLSDSFIREMAKWEGPDKSLLLADAKGRVWVYAPIYEFELLLVKVGQTIRIETAALPGKNWEGQIRSIDAMLDPATRSAKARVLVTDREGLLKPEMYVDVSLDIELGELMGVPEEAVFDTGTRKIVFVDKGQGLFEPREVKVGVKADGYVEIKNGISESESVVTSGNFLIDSESRLKSALDGQ